MSLLSDDDIAEAAQRREVFRESSVSTRLTRKETRNLDALAKSRGMQRGDGGHDRQALRLDPDNVELAALSQSIKSQIEREHKLSEALRQGHAALYAGDLGEAGIAVKKALQIDQKHTEARALESLIEKELAERQRRSQYQGLLEEARQEISSRNFLSALNYLQKAKAIDPADTNISELINWAAKGHLD